MVPRNASPSHAAPDTIPGGRVPAARNSLERLPALSRRVPSLLEASREFRAPLHTLANALSAHAIRALARRSVAMLGA